MRARGALFAPPIFSRETRKIRECSCKIYKFALLAFFAAILTSIHIKTDEMRASPHFLPGSREQAQDSCS
jgi:hypothetical protein